MEQAEKKKRTLNCRKPVYFQETCHEISQLYDEIHNLFKTGQTEAKKEEKLAQILAVLSEGPF